MRSLGGTFPPATRAVRSAEGTLREASSRDEERGGDAPWGDVAQPGAWSECCGKRHRATRPGTARATAWCVRERQRLPGGAATCSHVVPIWMAWARRSLTGRGWRVLPATVRIARAKQARQFAASGGDRERGGVDVLEGRLAVLDQTYGSALVSTSAAEHGDQNVGQ